LALFFKKKESFFLFRNIKKKEVCKCLFLRVVFKTTLGVEINEVGQGKKYFIIDNKI